jgi:hypothetical protein
VKCRIGVFVLRSGGWFWRESETNGLGFYSSGLLFRCFLSGYGEEVNRSFVEPKKITETERWLWTLMEMERQ